MFLAYMDCSDAHPSGDLTQLVPLVQTLEDYSTYISTRPLNIQGNWGVSFFDKWEPVLKVNSFTNEGKMVWAQACGLEAEFKVLLASYS